MEKSRFYTEIYWQLSSPWLYSVNNMKEIVADSDWVYVNTQFVSDLIENNEPQ